MKQAITLLRQSGHLMLSGLNLLLFVTFFMLFLVTLDLVFFVLAFWQLTCIMYNIEFSKGHDLRARILKHNEQLIDQQIVAEHKMKRLENELETAEEEIRELRHQLSAQEVKPQTVTTHQVPEETPKPKPKRPAPKRKPKTKTDENKN